MGGRPGSKPCRLWSPIARLPGEPATSLDGDEGDRRGAGLEIEQGRAEIPFAAAASDGDDRFGRFSGQAARRAATATLAPVLIPPKIPSSRASRRPHSNASSLVAVSTPRSRLMSRSSWERTLPRYPGFCAAPACRRKSPENRPVRRRSPGIAAAVWRRNRVTPVIVPPVPTPATNRSTCPARSAQISGPLARCFVDGGISWVLELLPCAARQAARDLERKNCRFFNVVITLRVMSCRHGGA